MSNATKFYPVHYDETTIEQAAVDIHNVTYAMREPRPQNRYAACRFCGQFVDFTGVPLAWDADIAEEATLRCSCPDAKRYADQLTAARRARENRQFAIEDARQIIDDLFGDGAVGYGRVPIKEETRQHILDAAIMIYDRRMKAVTINLTSCIKVKITKNSKDKLIIERSDSAVNKQEVAG
ncbi:hypothetical protein [Marasmitruncus massiliensis]|uniref:hypothetical protein n=1 Tax=Marasmitruncus massiliensis TaxID=1944642 RepID=UPI000C7D71AB|nr:hypothetical protein [Marasmitruncus massiliensis]